jgi:hypothetical protein
MSPLHRNTVKQPTGLLFGGKVARKYWEGDEIMFYRGTATTNPKSTISNSSSSSNEHCYYYILQFTG